MKANASDDESPRESQLPGHFKGEGSSQAIPAVAIANAPSLPRSADDPSDDTQLKAALDTLRTWTVFKKSIPEPSPKAAIVHP